MKILLIPIVLAICLPMMGQSISPQVIASSGASYTQPSVQLDYTVGEVAVTSYTLNNTLLTQGFHQPFIIIEAIDNPLNEFSFSVYPNPTSEMVVLNTDKPLKEGLSISLVDAKGSEILKENWLREDAQKQIDLSSLAEGTYFLRLITLQGEASRTFKVQKLNH